MNCLAKDLNPDLILLTETWCSDDTTNEFLSIDGYTLQTDLRRDRTDTANGAGGGLLVYSRIGLEIFCIDSDIVFNQYCKFAVKGKLANTHFTLIYRSPNAPREEIIQLEELLRSAEENSIVIGDFNLPGVRWEEGISAQWTAGLLEAAETRGLVQLVTFPTQVRGNILDLIFVDRPDTVVQVEECGRLGKSDHSVLMLTTRADVLVAKTTEKVPNWGKADWDSIKAAVSSEHWRDTVRRKGAVEAWEAVKSRLEEAVAAWVPLKPRRDPRFPGWMSRDILLKIRKKRRMWKAAKRGERVEEYKQAEKEVTNMIRKAKRRMEKKLATETTKNSKPFYAYVKKKTRSRTTVGPIKKANGELSKGDAETAEELNNFFTSVFTSDSGSSTTADRRDIHPKLKKPSITTQEVRKKLEKLSPYSAAGPDGIGPRLLKELSVELAPLLAHVFRSSLAEGRVPEDWKKANVTPIHKKGPKAEPGNYRPVSLTSVSCKVMESILKDKVIAHLDRHNLQESSQHGFMKGRSCTTNLLEFLELVTEATDKGQSVDVVFLDFTKAFDKVPHKRLLSKLSSFGLSGKLLAWIKDWLLGRTQRVVLNGKFSSWTEVLSGVPQGSVLGPLLFSVFIHDIDDAATKLDAIRKFADDTKGMKIIKGSEDRQKMQEALDELYQWAELWGMAFNIPKCKVMHVGHGNPRFDYTMAGQKLSVTEEERDIGVIMSRNLRPKAQCEKAARTGLTVLKQLERAFHYRDRHVFVRLYKQYVRPHLEFAVQAWAPWTAGDVECLEKVQKKAVKMVSGLAGTTYEDRLKELKMPTLSERREEFDMVQTFKIVSGIDRVEESHWFERAGGLTNGGARTRQQAEALNLRLKFGRTEVRKNFFSERVVPRWNRLPSELRQVSSVESFKKGLRKIRSEDQD
jgi:hypothetical protein